MSTALVLAGGGERAVAWELGVVAGLGMDPDLVVGTSAGSLVGTLTAARVAPADGVSPPPSGPPTPGEGFVKAATAWLEEGLEPGERRRRVGALALEADTEPEEDFVAATARRLGGLTWPEGLMLTAVDTESGERVAFAAEDGVPLERAVAASRAIPGLRPPITIWGRRYMDGGVGSATNADLASAAERVVVVTPNPAEAPEGTLFAIWEEALREELAALGDARLVQAGPEDLEAMGPDMLSGERAAEAFAAGRRAGGRLLQ